MYPDITPTVSVESTISNPDRPVQTIGFSGRNKRTGNDAVVLMDSVITVGYRSCMAIVPDNVVEKITDGAELLVIREGRAGDDLVYAITKEDFLNNRGETIYPQSGKPVSCIDLDTPKVRQFSRSETELEINNE